MPIVRRAAGSTGGFDPREHGGQNHRDCPNYENTFATNHISDGTENENKHVARDKVSHWNPAQGHRVDSQIPCNRAGRATLAADNIKGVAKAFSNIIPSAACCWDSCLRAVSIMEVIELNCYIIAVTIQIIESDKSKATTKCFRLDVEQECD